MSTSTPFRPATALLSALALATALVPPLRADDADDIKQLRAEIETLEQKLSVVERKQEIRDETAAAASKSATKVSIGDGGLVVASGDGANAFHLGAQVQFDSREFFGDGGIANNSFILRRARLLLDGKLDKIYSYQFVPEFGNGSGGTANAVAIYDANLTIAPTDEVQFKFGKFKTPIGLEILQPDQSTYFVERSLVTNLEPNRDVGAQVGGRYKGVVSYSVGLFNGIPDAVQSSGNSDFDNDKDVDGRVFVEPFANQSDSPLHGLGVGVAGGDGREKTHSAVTSGYKTAGQQTFFTYNGSVYTDGQVWRVSPQGYYYHGPFGALTEYIVSTINVRPSAPVGANFPAKTQLENKAWAFTAGYVLTGEDANYTGVTPNEPFNWDNGTWGAFQVVARYEDLKIDPKAFSGASPLASPSTNANQASAFGVGFNWYLTKAVRISQDYFDTRFSVTTRTAATPQLLKQDEKALVTRVQVTF